MFSALVTICITLVEPTTVKQLIADPAWIIVIKHEFDALAKKNTLSLVPLPDTWVVRGISKRNSDGSL